MNKKIIPFKKRCQFNFAVFPTRHYPRDIKEEATALEALKIVVKELKRNVNDNIVL